MSEEDHSRVDALLEGAAKLAVKPEGEHLDDAVLLAYHRHTLDEAAEKRADDHLATCSECRNMLASISELPDLSARRAKNALHIGRRPSRWLPAAAAILLVAGATSLLFLRADPSTSYTIEGPFGAIEELRGQTSLSNRFDANATVRILVRPDTATQDRPQISTTIAPLGGSPVETKIFDVRWTSSGAAELEAPAKQLFAAPGKYSITVRVGEVKSEYQLDYIE